MLAEQIQMFAELGKLFAQLDLQSDFADAAVTDPDVLEELRGLLEQETGRIDRVFDVTLAPNTNTFKGKAEQKLNLAKSQFYQFDMSPEGWNYKLIPTKSVNPEMAEFDEGSDEDWAGAIEFAAKAGKAGKKLNCKPGNVQCGGKCQNGSLNCRFLPSGEQKQAVEKVAKKAKAAATPKSKPSKTAKPETETVKPTGKAKDKKKSIESSPTLVEHKPFMAEKDAVEYTKDSYYKDRVFFHGTSEDGADAIVAKGVDPSRNVYGVYGQGFYLGASSAETSGWDTASSYARKTKEDDIDDSGNQVSFGRVLEMRVNVKKPYVADSGEFLAKIDELSKSGEIDTTDPRELSKNITNYFKKQGYDAVEITDQDYLNVFDSKSVAIYAKHNNNDEGEPPSSVAKKVVQEQTTGRVSS